MAKSGILLVALAPAPLSVSYPDPFFASSMTATATLEETNERVRQAAGWVSRLRETVGKVVVGQEALIDRLLVGLLANGHVLLEGVPGLAKTLSVRTLASAIHASFHRIQFTPDLLPADIVGTLIYSPQ